MGNLGSPPPLPDTVRMLRDVARNMPGGLRPGDRVMVCNSGQCVTYVFTNNEDWIGGTPQARYNGPGSGGGGEGGPSSPNPSPQQPIPGGSGGPVGVVVIGPIRQG